MTVRATAPGKLFLLGEYAVLDGSPALVAAVSARAQVSIRARRDGRWSLLTRQAVDRQLALSPGEACGVALLDTVLAARDGDATTLPPCDIHMDTRAFFSRRDGQKFGLGSSAALLVALDAAVAAYQGREIQDGAHLARLRVMHDEFQGSRGSGGDLAASLHGGLICYRSAAGDAVEIGSVELPNSVGFACICTGQAASSPEFVGLFRRWQAEQPQRSAAHMADLDRVARAGSTALVTGDGDGFLAAVAAYGQLLAELGGMLGAQISTPEHEQLKQLAERYGVIYKSSGAGGGDMGVGFAQNPESLAAFVAACEGLGFQHLDLAVDARGLILEEILDD